MTFKFNLSSFGVIKAEEPVAVDNRKRVQSFDVFDTLISRRCIEAAKIFEQIGIKANIPDFAHLRRKAETAVAKGPYTLDDIYRQLRFDLNLTEAAANKIKALEIATEMDAVIPIAENMAKVNDGDLLLSDMYLSQAAILQLLVKAGLKKHAELVVTSHGKRSGALWPEVLRAYAIERHLGDNRHSDVAMPTQFGIPGLHTSLATPTPLESRLIETGLRDLAILIREARLTTWHPDPTIRRLQLIQVSFNFPLLVLASIGLFRLAKKRGVSRLLFASRDCNMWLPLAEVLARQMNVSFGMEYFYTSRKARVQPSSDYLTYARDRLSGQSLLIDICGTGWSGARLMQHLGLKNGHVFYIHYLGSLAVYENKHPTPDNCAIHSIIGPAKANFSNPRFEMCNYAEHASVTAVHFTENGEVVPVFDRDERPDAVKSFIKEQRCCFFHMLELLKTTPLDETLSLSDDAIAKLIATLYGSLSQEDVLNSVYGQSHRSEDTNTLRDLGLLAN